MSGLIIKNQDKKPLTKNQDFFNKLILKIEKLNKGLEKKTQEFEAGLKLFSGAVLPLRKDMVEADKILLKLLFKSYKSKEFKGQQQEALRHIMQQYLDEIIELGDTIDDKEIQEIFEMLEGETYQESIAREQMDATEELANLFAQEKIKVDMDDPEDIAAKIQELRQKERDRVAMQDADRARRESKRKKNAAEIKREKLKQEAEEFKQKNISSIYKQLAKIFHPDLEQDESKKAEKVQLMQQLTAAYKANDIHTLLLLELKWINKEQENLENMTDEKLAVYLEVLRQQVKELEHEKFMIMMKPQFSVLFENYGYDISAYPLKQIKDEKAFLEGDIERRKINILRLQSEQRLKYLRAFINEWQNSAHDIEGDIFSMLMAQAGRYK